MFKGGIISLKEFEEIPFPNRTAKACYYRYSMHLKKEGANLVAIPYNAQFRPSSTALSRTLSAEQHAESWRQYQEAMAMFSDDTESSEDEHLWN
jgi:G:T/U-mismatch repair DNA glycosylase